MKTAIIFAWALLAAGFAFASGPVRDCGDLHAENADQNTCALVTDVLTMLDEPWYRMALIKDFEAMAAANEGALVVAVQTKDDATAAIHQLHLICAAAGALCQIGTRPLGAGEINHVVNVFDRGAIEYMSKQEFERVQNNVHSSDSSFF